jgi:L-asparagine transporter-like permease
MGWFKNHLNWTFIIASGIAVLLLALIVYLIELADSEMFSLLISFLNIAIVLGWALTCAWIMNRKRESKKP